MPKHRKTWDSEIKTRQVRITISVFTHTSKGSHADFAEREFELLSPFDTPNVPEKLSGVLDTAVAMLYKLLYR